MMSSLLLSFLRSISSSYTTQSAIDQDENNENDMEPLSIKIVSDNTGKLVDTHQIHHYYYCADTLSHMSFFDFCWYVKLKEKPKDLMLKTHMKLIWVFLSDTH